MTLITPLMTIFSVIIFGIICCKQKIFDDAQIEGFEALLFKILMPCYLFVSVYESDFMVLMNMSYIYAYLLTFMIMSIIITLVFFRTKSIIEVLIRILAASYVNSAKYALPIITILFKDPLAGIIGNLLQVIIIQPIFILVLNLLSDDNGSVMDRFKEVIGTPLVFMPILAVFLNYFQVPVPAAVFEAVAQISSSASGLALFSIGLTIGSTKLSRKLLKLDLISMVTFKNFVHPSIAAIVATYMHLGTYWFNSLIILCAAPTAFVVYYLSKQFAAETATIKSEIFLSTILSMISFIIIALILG